MKVRTLLFLSLVRLHLFILIFILELHTNHRNHLFVGSWRTPNKTSQPHPRSQIRPTPLHRLRSPRHRPLRPRRTPNKRHQRHHRRLSLSTQLGHRCRSPIATPRLEFIPERYRNSCLGRLTHRWRCMGGESRRCGFACCGSSCVGECGCYERGLGRRGGVDESCVECGGWESETAGWMECLMVFWHLWPAFCVVCVMSVIDVVLVLLSLNIYFCLGARCSNSGLSRLATAPVLSIVAPRKLDGPYIRTVH